MTANGLAINIKPSFGVAEEIKKDGFIAKDPKALQGDEVLGA